jgi:hypothetical protein
MSKKRTFLKIIVPVFLLVVLAMGAFVLKHLLNRPEAFEVTIQAEDAFVPHPKGINVETWPRI